MRGTLGIMELLHDHPLQATLAAIVIIVIGMACLTTLILFVRWIVHTEMTAFTSSLHTEVATISARLDHLVRRKWSDEKLDDKFVDIATVLRAHDEDLGEIRADHLKFHGGEK